MIENLCSDKQFDNSYIAFKNLNNSYIEFESFCFVKYLKCNFTVLLINKRVAALQTFFFSFRDVINTVRITRVPDVTNISTVFRCWYRKDFLFSWQCTLCIVYLLLFSQQERGCTSVNVIANCKLVLKRGERYILGCYASASTIVYDNIQ